MNNNSASQKYIDEQISNMIKEVIKEQDLVQNLIGIKEKNTNINIIKLASKSELPNIGNNTNTIYFIKNENKSYKFDADRLIYVITEYNCDNSPILNGGDAVDY